MNTISFIGAGNVAFRMAIALQEKGYMIPTVWNRTREKAVKLTRALNSNLSAYTAHNAAQAGTFTPVPTGAPSVASESFTDLLASDMVIIAVSDDAISTVARSFAQVVKDNIASGNITSLPICVHTCGATPLDALSPLKDVGCRCGVLYPLMTLSRSKNVNFRDIPFLLEGSCEKTLKALKGVCDTLGSEYYLCNSEKRLRMHTAAVFSCNFTNYLLSLAFEISGDAHSLLLPTTLEMIRKSFLQSPKMALTGPAKRGDMKTITKHLELLESLGMKEHADIYRTITDNLITRTKQ